jgi:hypothetical protein
MARALSGRPREAVVIHSHGAVAAEEEGNAMKLKTFLIAVGVLMVLGGLLALLPDP